jgi:acyl-coenzyme A synthetase/AMP-(fatty) acid ligase/3-hydroxymyristoyl/3-hydroxydecanoyl-(acyl carrier protein) dehydratase
MSSRVIPLCRLLVSAGDGNDIIATGVDGDRDRIDFTRDVTALTGRLRATGGERWLIADSDAYAIAVGVFATLHAGGQAILPANLQAGHLEEVARAADGVLTDGMAVASTGHSLSLFDPAEVADAPVLAVIDADTAEIVLHTSGTTGAPTSICKPLRCFEAELASQSRVFDPEPGKTVIATVPPYHIYGLLFRILWPLATNRPFSTDTVSYPEELAIAAGTHKDCMFVSSPAFLKRALPVLDLDRLRLCLGPVFSSGGLLPPPVAATYNSGLAHPVIEVFGSTETGGIAYRSVLDEANPPSWHPLPNVEVATDPETGVLSVRSPFIPDAKWFQAGDRAEIDGDGRFQLKGRADRIVKVEEERVSLPEIENRLLEHPAVAAARVVLLDGEEEKRQVIGAVVEPSAHGWAMLSADGRQAVRGSLLDVLRPHLAAVVLPRKWRFVTRIPEDDRGKTSDASLTALFLADQGRTILPDITAEKIDTDGARLQIHLPDDLFYFQGHFDNTPILAGVVQLNWAIEFACQNLAISGVFQRIEALKFFNVLMAGDDVTLVLRYDRETARLTFEYVNGDTRYSSGRVIFGSAP